MSDEPTTSSDVPRLSTIETPGGRWGRLADRLGLVAVASPSIFGRRVKLLVGERNGYLVSVSSAHSINTSSVDVIARYPQGHTVRGFAEDLKRKIRWTRRKHVFIGDGSVMQRLPYAVFRPRVAAVERATDDLVAAMSELVKPLDRACEGCLQPNDLGLFVADGVPFVYCDSCLAAYLRDQDVQVESTRSTTPDVGHGLVVGIGAALALGLAIGALASVAVIFAKDRAPLFAAPLFVVLGYLTSAFASRGFVGSSVSTTLLKLPLALAAVPIGTTFMTAVGRMTLEPAEWSVLFLWSSFAGPFVHAPRAMALLVACAAAGWLLECAIGLFAGRRRPRKKRVAFKRIER